MTTYTWTGAANDGQWTTKTNWSPSTGYPGKSANDMAVFPTPTSFISVTIGQSIQLSTITIPPTSVLNAAYSLNLTSGVTLTVDNITGGPGISGSGAMCVLDGATLVIGGGYIDNFTASNSSSIVLKNGAMLTSSSYKPTSALTTGAITVQDGGMINLVQPSSGANFIGTITVINTPSNHNQPVVKINSDAGDVFLYENANVQLYANITIAGTLTISGNNISFNTDASTEPVKVGELLLNGSCMIDTTSIRGPSRLMTVAFFQGKIEQITSAGNVQYTVQPTQWPDGGLTLDAVRT